MPLRMLLAACASTTLLAALAAPAGAQTFSNPSLVEIPSAGVAAPYPSEILVSGVAEPVEELRVTLTEFAHDWPADVDVLLVGPQGQNLVLMSDVGSGVAVSGLTLVFEDAAPSALGTAELSSGFWRPSDRDDGPDVFPAPAPAPSGATELATFQGTDPNGVWSLYVVNDGVGDTGSIGRWSLTLPEPGAGGALAAVLALLALAAREQGARRSR